MEHPVLLIVDGAVERRLDLTFADLAGLPGPAQVRDVSRFHPTRRGDGVTLEAGTGGGRIVRAMAALGFTRLAGFDFAPELIDAARRADAAGAIDFRVADATALPYGDAEFDQALYLQQIVCTIESRGGRRAALAEAARVLRPGGVALFSLEAISHLVRPPFYGRLFWSAFLEVAWFSLPVVALTAVFTGIVLALQSYTGFARFNAQSAVASVVVISLVRELGPVLAALMVAEAAEQSRREGVPVEVKKVEVRKLP